MIGALIAKRKTASAYKSLNSRDISRFLAGWHDEATWIYPGDLSVSGEFKGKKSIGCGSFRTTMSSSFGVMFTTFHRNYALI